MPRTTRNCHKTDYYEHVYLRWETPGAKEKGTPIEPNRARMADGGIHEVDWKESNQWSIYANPMPTKKPPLTSDGLWGLGEDV